MKKNEISELSSFVNQPVRESLAGLTVNELKGIAEDLNLSVTSRMRKADLVDMLYHYFMNDVQKWIRLLPEYEVVLLRDLSQAGAECMIERYNIIGIPCLEHMALITSGFSQDEDLKIRFVISRELQAALQSVDWEAILKDPEQKLKYEIEQYAYGLLNLYGLLLMKDTIDTVYQLMDGRATEGQLMKAFLESLGLRTLLCVHPDDKLPHEIWMRSFYLDNIEEIFMQLQQHADIGEVAAYSQAEIARAGKMPVMDLSEWRTDELNHWMRKMGYEEEEADSVLLYLWYASQYDCNLSSLLSTTVGGRLNSMEELKGAMESLIAFLNRTPQWVLMGNSPEAVSRMSQAAPKTPFLAEPKVGRNDPCPCGSGKKYKHCCGMKN